MECMHVVTCCTVFSYFWSELWCNRRMYESLLKLKGDDSSSFVTSVIACGHVNLTQPEKCELHYCILNWKKCIWANLCANLSVQCAVSTLIGTNNVIIVMFCLSTVSAHTPGTTSTFLERDPDFAHLWSDSSEHLNLKQMEAMKKALQYKFTLIQGPPGMQFWHYMSSIICILFTWTHTTFITEPSSLPLSRLAD